MLRQRSERAKLEYCFFRLREALYSITQSLLNPNDEVILFEPFFDFFYFQSV